MKKISDLKVVDVQHPREDYVVLRLQYQGADFPEVRAGQFVEVRVPDAPTTFLRRPISINAVCRDRGEISLLIHAVGDGTRRLLRTEVGSSLSCIFPLGNGFSIPSGAKKRMLLVGGGVGTAPLLQYGRDLAAAGHEATFLLGGRSACDLLQLDLFEQIGRVFTTTEDASLGERGFVTDHSLLQRESFDAVATCGPKPMMMAVARYARAKGLPCEASLENLMACGLGACLCCVEKTNEGHNVCVCKDGPVFNIDLLQWPN